MEIGKTDGWRRNIPEIAGNSGSPVSSDSIPTHIVSGERRIKRGYKKVFNNLAIYREQRIDQTPLKLDNRRKVGKVVPGKMRARARARGNRVRFILTWRFPLCNLVF